MPKHILLKKGEERRIRHGHPWIFSNEIDNVATPLKSFVPGQEAQVFAADKKPLGVAYINPHSLICGRLFSQNPEAHLDLTFFREQIIHAAAARQVLFHQPYYRLVYGEADNLPGLIIDRYGNDFVVQTNTAGMENCIDVISTTLQEIYPNINSIYLHNDSQLRTLEGLMLYSKEIFGQAPEEVELIENEVKFIAPLQEGQKTAWFYDHRMNRARLAAYVKDKKVLDVFCYVGGWGIQAAVNGAEEVTFVDSSKTACDYVKQNAELNQVSDKVHIINENAFDALKLLREQNRTYDVIVLDPPAFIKKAKDRKEGLIAYQRMNEAAFKILNSGGILVSCSCSMHLEINELLDIIKRSAYNTQSKIQVLERGHQGPDHPLHPSIPETDYLKAWFIRKI